MRFPRCLVTGFAFLVLVGAASCSSNYQPPNHTYTGYPEYVGVGVSVWGNGQVSPVLIGGPTLPPPEATPDVILKQQPLDAIF
jgi:hypothetical protein